MALLPTIHAVHVTPVALSSSVHECLQNAPVLIGVAFAAAQAAFLLCVGTVLHTVASLKTNEAPQLWALPPLVARTCANDTGLFGPLPREVTIVCSTRRLPICTLCSCGGGALLSGHLEVPHILPCLMSPLRPFLRSLGCVSIKDVQVRTPIFAGLFWVSVWWPFLRTRGCNPLAVLPLHFLLSFLWRCLSHDSFLFTFGVKEEWVVQNATMSMIRFSEIIALASLLGLRFLRHPEARPARTNGTVEPPQAP